MESSPPTASPSLKKLKREAAQHRKAQARSLKLRADEQERLQRLEIDALVEQQRFQRLERQRCEELVAARVVLQGNSAPGSAVRPGSGGPTALQQHQVVISGHDGKCKPMAVGISSSSNKANQNLQQQQQQQHHPQHHPHQDPKSRGGPNCNACMPDSGDQQQPLHKSKAGLKGGGGGLHGVGGWRGKESQRSKHAQQQSMRAAVESRRRLARGPRSGVVADAHGSALPSEDHRVVSTEYQAAGTQALMRVTLLAAGFVIGARGISARLIGQVTGAIVQSWTESCRPDAVPIRLFRIQGKKAVVQAAVGLIGQAVAKYKDLCDCKRRGEFVQREHVINGVEFYYQPPPRKAFAINVSDQQQQQQSCCGKPGSAAVSKGDSTPSHGAAGGQGHGAGAGDLPNSGNPPSQLSFTPHHAWLQHFQAQQQHQKQQQQQQTLQEQQQQTSSELQAVQSTGHGGMGMVDGRSLTGQIQPGFFDWRTQHQHQQQVLVGNSSQGKILPGSNGDMDQDLEKDGELMGVDGSGLVVDSMCTSTSELERIDQGLQQSVASLEQALQQVRLEQRLLQHNRVVADIGSPAGGGSVDNSRSGTITIGNTLKQQQQQLQTVGNERVPNFWPDVGGGGYERTPGFQLGSSLFSIFGSGELPMPISNSHDGRSSGGVVDGVPAGAAAGAAVSALGLQQQQQTMNSSMSSSPTGGPFDIPRCDFLRESMHAFPFAPRDNSPRNSCSNGSISEYSLYGHSKNNMVGDSGADSSLCIVCLEQPAGVRLMACGHASFCLACVQGLVNCPLCREKIVGLHPSGPTSRVSSSVASAAATIGSTAAAQQRGGPAVATKLNGSAYHLWTWVPGAPV